MPLKISLKANERVIVNGAVMQNGDHPAQILVHNEVSLLREKDILTEEETTTPARRVYYALQCVYLFPAKAETFLPAFYMFLSEFGEAAPSAGELVTEIRLEAEQGRLYQALRKARRLIEKEEEILHAFATSRDI
jgi:flagellar protein FlbT